MFDFLGAQSVFPIDAALLALAFLAFLAFLACYKSFNVLLWVWDDGNNLYPAHAMLKGKYPNVDYRSGYPGMQSALFAFLFRHFGPSIFVAKAAAFAASMVTAVIVAVITGMLFPFGAVLGLFTFALAFFCSYPVFSSANAGFFMEACASVAIFALVLALGAGSVTALTYGAFAVAAVFLGLSFCFKQPGLFFLLGFFAVLTVFCEHDTALTNALRMTAYGAGCLLPFALFLFLRTKTVRAVGEYSRLTVFLPWIAGLALTGKMVFAGQEAMQPAFTLPIGACLGFALLALASTFLWVLIYKGGLKDWKKVLQECFVIVPPLIDRDWPHVPFCADSKKLLVLCVTALVAISGLAWLPTDIFFHPAWSDSVDALVRLGGGLVVALILVTSARLREALRNLFWIPALLGGSTVLMLTLHQPVPLSPQSIAVLVMGLAATISIYPYRTNYMFAVTGIVTCLMVYLYAMYQYSAALPAWLAAPFLGLGLALVLGATIANYGFLRERWETQKATTQGNGFYFYKRDESFLWVAGWLRQYTQPDTTIIGYPNFALSFMLADRVAANPLPNFLGSDSEFAQLVASVSDDQGPEIVIVSPCLHPYGEVTPYAPSPQPLLDVLPHHYNLVAQCAVDGGGRILAAIYRKKQAE